MTRAEWDEAWREVSEADGALGTTWEITEGAVEVTGQVLEGTLDTVTFGVFS